MYIYKICVYFKKLNVFTPFEALQQYKKQQQENLIKAFVLFFLFFFFFSSITCFHFFCEIDKGFLLRIYTQYIICLYIYTIIYIDIGSLEEKMDKIK